MTIFVLELKKIEMIIKQKIAFFIQIQKQKQLLMKVMLTMCLNHLILKSNIQTSLGKDSGWIINSDIKHSINISKYNL